MKSTEIAEMLEEYNDGGSFRDYVNRCMATYKTDLVTEIHKAITFEVFRYMHDSKKKGNMYEKQDDKGINSVTCGCIDSEDRSC